MLVRVHEFMLAVVLRASVVAHPDLVSDVGQEEWQHLVGANAIVHPVVCVAVHSMHQQ